MKTNTFSTPKALRLTGSFCLVLAILTVLTSVLAYLPVNPDFSIFNTYLSDIGDTAGWPQVLFNSGLAHYTLLKKMNSNFLLLKSKIF